MDEVTKDLLDALRDLIDSHWLHDSHAVDFDGTVLFSPSYEFSNLHCHRRSELRMDGFECVVWPGWYPDFKWSAYSTYEGSLWFEQFDSEAEARAVCMKLLADVMPEHSVSKAMAAIARAEAALAEPQPDADGWIPWAGTTKHPTDIPPNTAVEVKLRSGATAVRNIAQSTVSVVLAPEGFAYGFDWTINGTAGDILAYRIVRK